MSKLIWHVTMSLDGFIAGPDDSMDWVFEQWTEKAPEIEDIRVDKSPLADEIVRTTGAILAGRRWYDVALSRFKGGGGDLRWRLDWSGCRTHPSPAGR
jgi:dihydrofolate reductase